MPIASGYDYNLSYSDGADDAPQRSVTVGHEWSGSTSDHFVRPDVVQNSDGNSKLPVTQNVSDLFSPNGSRLEIIERIKRSQNPDHWPPYDEDYTANRNEDSKVRSVGVSLPPFVSPINFSDMSTQPQGLEQAQSEPTSNVERPRSALHRGDFHGDGFSQSIPGQVNPIRPTSHENSWLGTSPPAPWRSRYPLPTPQQYHDDPVSTLQVTNTIQTPPQRLRAASHSLRSAFVFRAPTSPLANLSNSDDLDMLEQHAGRARDATSDKFSRRHTISPNALRELRRSPPSPYQLDPFNDSEPDPSFRRGGSFPYQAHQPRRSLASFDDAVSCTSARVSSAHSRRPSMTSETSPQQRLPMVGRYEESILRGRMSSLPSRPLDFVAQIGVLGRGSCKASLKCPAHVTVPFPAIFYHYGNLPGASSSDGPSPYVGLVDLEKSAYVADDANVHLRHQQSETTQVSAEDSDMMDVDQYWLQNSQGKRSKSGKQRTLKDGPVGSYRIPEQGQVQVIVRNPNKTAVKLFLVPYDLNGMEPGQKTFVRQRSYSAGPILDMPLDARRNLGTDRPEAALSHSDDPRERPVLRYLIHLHICCVARGRYYLYKNIRIVFANRVPDGKEKLRQEIQLPEPRFSIYKPESSGNVHDTLVHRTTPRMSRLGAASTFSEKSPVVGDVTIRSRQEPVLGPYTQHNYSPLDAGVVTSSMGRLSASRALSADVSLHDEAISPKTTLDKDNSPSPPVDSLQFSPSLFGKLGRSEWTPNGTPPRTYSPQPGEGLIAQQYRSWAERKNSTEPY